MTLLSTRHLEVGYRRIGHRDRKLVGPVNLALRPGQLTCLLGPNGIGKSTLLRTLAGLQKPLAGDVYLDNTALSALPPRQLAKTLSLVLTEPVPVGSLSLWSLVSMGRYPHTDWRGHLSSADEHAVQRALHKMGISSLSHRPMNALSDGERQKAMIARALAQEPQVMILDEALAFLDWPRRVELFQLLRDLARTSGCAILLSCHDLDMTLRYADRVWLISHGGQLREGIPEDLVLSGEFAAAFALGTSLDFDPYQGAFVPPRAPAARVRVQGEKLGSLWASRALERAGFEVVHDRAQWCVSVVCGNQPLAQWQLAGHSSATGAGLESLLAALEQSQSGSAPEQYHDRMGEMHHA